jgi:hypothetical protein
MAHLFGRVALILQNVSVLGRVNRGLVDTYAPSETASPLR